MGNTWDEILKMVQTKTMSRKQALPANMGQTITADQGMTSGQSGVTTRSRATNLPDAETYEKDLSKFF